MTAAVVTPQRLQSGLRRLRPARDLPALADLIEIAYKDELSLTNSNLVERLRQLATMAPLIGIAESIAPLLDGYVWFEDDQLVGNVTLNRDARVPGGWTMSNVAVLPEYRGRGIAGRLVDAALAHLAEVGARCVLLQVRTDNAPAIALYRHRGFAVYEAIQELRLTRSNLQPVIYEPDPRIGPLQSRDAKCLLRLARQCQPGLLRSLRPARRSDLGLALWQQLARMAAQAMGLPTLPTLVARTSRGIGGFARLTSIGRGSLHLELSFAPSRAEELAPPLLAATLAASRHAPWSQLLVEIPSEATETQLALEAIGFEPLRTLHGMIWEPPRSPRYVARGR